MFWFIFIIVALIVWCVFMERVDPPNVYFKSKRSDCRNCSKLEDSCVPNGKDCVLNKKKKE